MRSGVTFCPIELVNDELNFYYDPECNIQIPRSSIKEVVYETSSETTDVKKCFVNLKLLHDTTEVRAYERFEPKQLQQNIIPLSVADDRFNNLGEVPSMSSDINTHKRPSQVIATNRTQNFFPAKKSKRDEQQSDEEEMAARQYLGFNSSDSE